MPNKLELFLFPCTANVAETSPVIKTPVPAGFTVIADKSPPKAPIEPAIELNLAVPPKLEPE